MKVFNIFLSIFYMHSAVAEIQHDKFDFFRFSGGDLSLGEDFELVRSPSAMSKYSLDTLENNVRHLSGKTSYKSTTTNAFLSSKTDVYIGDKAGQVQEVYEQVRSIVSDPSLYALYPKQGFNYVKLNGEQFEFQIQCTYAPDRGNENKKCYAVNPEVCSAVAEIGQDWQKYNDCKETIFKARHNLSKGELKAQAQWEEIQGNKDLIINKYGPKTADPFEDVGLSSMNSESLEIFDYMDTIAQMCSPYKAQLPPAPFATAGPSEASNQYQISQ